MIKCHDCNTEFDKTIEDIQDTGIFNVCPKCKSTYHDPVWQCQLCGDYFYAKDITKHTCHECAKKEYNVHLGLKFVGKNKADFFLRYIWGIEEIDKDLKSDLAYKLENDFIDEMDLEDDYNHHLKDLKSYCLNDIDSWIEFLEEEI